MKTDKKYVNKSRILEHNDGTTAATAFLIEDTLIVAHAGDSRIVLCRGKKAIELTHDHKPDRKDEKERIEKIRRKSRNLKRFRSSKSQWSISSI